MHTFHHSLMSWRWRPYLETDDYKNIRASTQVANAIDECRAHINTGMKAQRSHDGRIVAMVSLTFAFADEENVYFDYCVAMREIG